jgi:hypothetical protein
MRLARRAVTMIRIRNAADDDDDDERGDAR